MKNDLQSYSMLQQQRKKVQVFRQNRPPASVLTEDLATGIVSEFLRDCPRVKMNSNKKETNTSSNSKFSKIKKNLSKKIPSKVHTKDSGSNSQGQENQSCSKDGEGHSAVVNIASSAVGEQVYHTKNDTVYRTNVNNGNNSTPPNSKAYQCHQNKNAKSAFGLKLGQNSKSDVNCDNSTSKTCTTHNEVGSISQNNRSGSHQHQNHPNKSSTYENAGFRKNNLSNPKNETLKHNKNSRPKFANNNSNVQKASKPAEKETKVPSAAVLSKCAQSSQKSNKRDKLKNFNLRCSRRIQTVPISLNKKDICEGLQVDKANKSNIHGHDDKKAPPSSEQIKKVKEDAGFHSTSVAVKENNANNSGKPTLVSIDNPNKQKTELPGKQNSCKNAGKGDVHTESKSNKEQDHVMFNKLNKDMLVSGKESDHNDKTLKSGDTISPALGEGKGLTRGKAKNNKLTRIKTGKCMSKLKSKFKKCVTRKRIKIITSEQSVQKTSSKLDVSLLQLGKQLHAKVGGKMHEIYQSLSTGANDEIAKIFTKTSNNSTSLNDNTQKKRIQNKVAIKRLKCRHLHKCKKCSKPRQGGKNILTAIRHRKLRRIEIKNLDNKEKNKMTQNLKKCKETTSNQNIPHKPDLFKVKDVSTLIHESEDSPANKQDYHDNVGQLNKAITLSPSTTSKNKHNSNLVNNPLILFSKNDVPFFRKTPDKNISSLKGQSTPCPTLLQSDGSQIHEDKSGVQISELVQSISVDLLANAQNRPTKQPQTQPKLAWSSPRHSPSNASSLLTTDTSKGNNSSDGNQICPNRGKTKFCVTNDISHEVVNPLNRGTCNVEVSQEQPSKTATNKGTMELLRAEFLAHHHSQPHAQQTRWHATHEWVTKTNEFIVDFSNNKEGSHVSAAADTENLVEKVKRTPSQNSIARETDILNESSKKFPKCASRKQLNLFSWMPSVLKSGKAAKPNIKMNCEKQSLMSKADVELERNASKAGNSISNDSTDHQAHLSSSSPGHSVATSLQFSSTRNVSDKSAVFNPTIQSILKKSKQTRLSKSGTVQTAILVKNNASY